MSRNLLVVLVCGFAVLAVPAQVQDKNANLLALIQKLQSGSDADKLAAAVALADMGPEAVPAVPSLVAALQSKSEDLRLNAAIALGRIGAPAVGPVAKVLSSANASDRYYAIWTLGWIGPAAKETAPQVMLALADKDDGVRRKAAYALGRIAPDAQTAGPPLIKTLADGNTDVRKAAADALAKFGEQVVPLLIVALKSDSAAIRAEAAHALGNIGSTAKDAVDPLQMLFLGGDVKASQAAGDALAKIGKASIAVLTAALRDADAS